MRIHCGMGRFCFCFLARKRLILNVLCDDCKREQPLVPHGSAGTAPGWQGSPTAGAQPRQRGRRPRRAGHQRRHRPGSEAAGGPPGLGSPGMGRGKAQRRTPPPRRPPAGNPRPAGSDERARGVAARRRMAADSLTMARSGPASLRWLRPKRRKGRGDAPRKPREARAARSAGAAPPGGPAGPAQTALSEAGRAAVAVCASLLVSVQKSYG